jgi:hypothetical protein
MVQHVGPVFARALLERLLIAQIGMREQPADIRFTLSPILGLGRTP